MASETTTRFNEVSPGRLWFGLAASAFAWFGLGLAEMFITWRACLHNEEFGNASSHPASMAAAFAVSGFLIALAATAGFLSWNSWRRLAAERRLIDAEGRGRRDYMALLGMFVSLTLGAGMVWMLLPLFILQLCARIR